MPLHVTAVNHNYGKSDSRRHSRTDFAIRKSKKIVFYYTVFLIAVTVAGIAVVGKPAIVASASLSGANDIMLHPDMHALSVISTNSSNEPDIICFGDSDYFYPPYLYYKPDETALHLPSMLDEELTRHTGAEGRAISSWVFPAANMFDYYCMFFESLKYNPKLIIIPVNWRSFSSSWSRSRFTHRLLCAFVPLNVDLPGHENPLRIFGISSIRHVEYKAQFYSFYSSGMRIWIKTEIASLLTSDAQNSSEIPLTEPLSEEALGEKEKRAIFIPSRGSLQEVFPTEIRDSDIYFISLRALAKVASQHKVKVLFYIWPLDLEYFREKGYAQESSFSQSIQMIREVTEKENVYLLDLSGLLEHELFFDYQGHCKPEGRRKIARALAPVVAQIMHEGDLSKN